jgi:hypothetical protein
LLTDFWEVFRFFGDFENIRGIFRFFFGFARKVSEFDHPGSTGIIEIFAIFGILRMSTEFQNIRIFEDNCVVFVFLLVPWEKVDGFDHPGSTEKMGFLKTPEDF